MADPVSTTIRDLDVGRLHRAQIALAYAVSALTAHRAHICKLANSDAVNVDALHQAAYDMAALVHDEKRARAVLKAAQEQP